MSLPGFPLEWREYKRKVLYMKKFTILVLLGLFLSSCTLFHIRKMDIVQGNVITSEDLSQLHRGMNEDQVKAIMGNPVLINIFETNRIEYIYTIKKPADSKMAVTRVSCLFVNGRLSDIIRS